MKKWGIVSLSVVLILSIFLGYKHLNPQIIRPSADFYNYPLEEMEALATVIVEAEWMEEDSSIVRLDKKDKYPLETLTLSDIKIKKVHKGENLVKEGDTLKVVEYYAKWRDLAGSYQKMPNELYHPLVKGKSYFLFLYHGPTQPQDTYEIIGNHQGKFTIPARTAAKSALSIKELDIAENDQHYKQLYERVTSKYLVR